MPPRLTAVLVAEALGTFLFVFIGAGSVVLGNSIQGADLGGLVGVALAHGLALAVLISALGPISGGHFNPAVTFAVWISGRIEPMRAALYVVVQMAGALVAALALQTVINVAAWQPVATGTPTVSPVVGVTGAIIIEAILTVVLVIAVFGTAIDPRAPKVGGFAIGLAVTADVLMGGPLTGAAMNPARWFGPAVASGAFADWYVWLIGPLLGGAVAAVLYRFTLEEQGEADVTPATPEGG
ncbi:MAG TPA: aquaporin [Candidatus Limnocylindria bacterium]|nr:aquaporin [Candidatus Limnocylindria bacterium]